MLSCTLEMPSEKENAKPAENRVQPENAKPAENHVQLARENERLLRENAELLRDNAELVRKNAGLETQNQKLSAKSRELEDQLQHLVKDVDRVLDDNERLAVEAARVPQLEAKNARLLSEFTGEGRLDKGALRLAHVMELEGRMAKLAAENAQLNSKVLRLSTPLSASGDPVADGRIQATVDENYIAESGTPKAVKVTPEAVKVTPEAVSVPFAPAASPGRFAEGDRVKLVGLKGMSYLNGQCGIVSTFSQNGRWRVHLVDGQAKDVKPDNLMQAASTECDWAKIEASLLKPWLPKETDTPSTMSEAVERNAFEKRAPVKEAETGTETRSNVGVFGGLSFLGDVFGGEGINVGATVVVKTAFKSNSKSPVSLEVGQVGVVKTVDSDGDVEIDFQDHSSIQWVFHKHFDKLDIIRPAQPEGKSKEDEGPESSTISGMFGLFGAAQTTSSKEQPPEDFFGGMFGGMFRGSEEFQAQSGADAAPDATAVRPASPAPPDFCGIEKSILQDISHMFTANSADQPHAASTPSRRPSIASQGSDADSFCTAIGSYCESWTSCEEDEKINTSRLESATEGILRF